MQFLFSFLCLVLFFSERLNAGTTVNHHFLSDPVCRKILGGINLSLKAPWEVASHRWPPDDVYLADLEPEIKRLSRWILFGNQDAPATSENTFDIRHLSVEKQKEIFERNQLALKKLMNRYSLSDQQIKESEKLRFEPVKETLLKTRVVSASIPTENGEFALDSKQSADVLLRHVVFQVLQQLPQSKKIKGAVGSWDRYLWMLDEIDEARGLERGTSTRAVKQLTLDLSSVLEQKDFLSVQHLSDDGGTYTLTTDKDCSRCYVFDLQEVVIFGSMVNGTAKHPRGRESDIDIMLKRNFSGLGSSGGHWFDGSASKMAAKNVVDALWPRLKTQLHNNSLAYPEPYQEPASMADIQYVANESGGLYGYRIVFTLDSNKNVQAELRFQPAYKTLHLNLYQDRSLGTISTDSRIQLFR